MLQTTRVQPFGVRSIARGKTCTALLALCLLIACEASAKTYELDVTLQSCGTGCVEVEVENRFESPICIENAMVPYDGKLNANVFEIESIDDQSLATYLPIQPSVIMEPRWAVLVRLLQKNTVARSRIVLGDFYNIPRGQRFAVKFTARGYFCSAFRRDNKGYIILRGQAVLALRN